MDIQQKNRPGQAGNVGMEKSTSNGNRGSRRQKWLGAMKVTSVILLFSITVLIIALLVYIVTANKAETSQAAFVDTSKYQAVFLVNQQLPYFGKITALHSDYMVLEDIYYLQINQSVQPGEQNQSQDQDITLVKLGCELHGPEDRMIINTEQVFFWENLKSNGDSKVTEAIKQFQQQNPNGLVCQ